MLSGIFAYHKFQSIHYTFAASHMVRRAFVVNLFIYTKESLVCFNLLKNDDVSVVFPSIVIIPTLQNNHYWVFMMFCTADSLVSSEKCSNFVAELINKAYLTRRTRILLLILAAVLYFCSMACSASTRVFETRCMASLLHVLCGDEAMHSSLQAEETQYPASNIQYPASNIQYPASLEEDIYVHNANLAQEQTAFLASADEALPIARVKRTVQITSPTKVMKDRISSCGPHPKTIALAYKQYVTSHLQYSELIFLSLPSEEIAFPFLAFW